MPYRIRAIRSRWQEEGVLVRFNIGLEDTGDLIADIEQALTRL
jgi:cystathionine beta-lyase